MAELVSIIIPVFNRQSLVGETLDSIRNQSHTSWECILVDDGSTDKTIAVLEEYQAKDQRIKVFKRPSHLPKGAPSCRNYGFEQATGDYIQYFDSDDLMLPEMLLEKVEYLSKHKDAAFVVSKMAEFDENGVESFTEYKIYSANFMQDFLAYKVFFLTPGPLFRKLFLQKFAVKFDISLERRQEREFYTRIVLSNPNFGVIEKVHCLRRIHKSSIKGNFDTLRRVDYMKSKFNYYLRICRNTKWKYSRTLFYSNWYSLFTMARVLFKHGEISYCAKAFSLFLFLLFLTPFSK